jgi:glycosyltransferase
MKISVVTVALNSAATIRQSIDSFLAQRYDDKELIIVDAGSTDETVSIAKSFRDPSIAIVSEKDAGVYDGMNKGLRLFTGEAVGFLNSDDTFRTANALNFIAEGLTDAEVVYGDLYIVTDHYTKRVFRTWKAGEFSSSSFGLGWMPPHPTFYVRRNVVDSVGEFDLRYQIGGDYDYMLRALVVPGRKIKYVPHVLIDYQWGGISSGSLRGIIRGNLECLHSRRRHLNSPLVDRAFFLRPMRRLLQIRWSFILASILGRGRSASSIGGFGGNGNATAEANLRQEQVDLVEAFQGPDFNATTCKGPTSGASRP